MKIELRHHHHHHPQNSINNMKVLLSNVNTWLYYVVARECKLGELRTTMLCYMYNFLKQQQQEKKKKNGEVKLNALLYILWIDMAPRKN